jgi:hypothetical protein
LAPNQTPEYISTLIAQTFATDVGKTPVVPGFYLDYHCSFVTEIMYNNSGGAKFMAGSVCICRTTFKEMLIDKQFWPVQK